MNSQSAEILAHLRAGLSITPLDAFKWFGCMRLGARIYELKARGHDIYAVFERSGGKRYCRYFLRKTSRQDRPLNRRPEVCASGRY